MTSIQTPEQSELGKKSPYDAFYNPDKLFPISRQLNRDKIQVKHPLPFFGVDIWNHYEVSWLDLRGKPMVALAEIIYDCASPFLIESKSMKLYFNTFNNTKIKDVETLQAIIKKDLEERIGVSVSIKVTLLKDFKEEKILRGFDGISIDDLAIDCDTYELNPNFLSVENSEAEETLCSDLLKANCLVTNQPDWGSVRITYQGPKINRENLLRYIVSFRNCNEFAETSAERIFIDILTHCKPKKLTVYTRYTRRGGLDINPIRSTEQISSGGINFRFSRQ